jgi:hypothetical protein
VEEAGAAGEGAGVGWRQPQVRAMRRTTQEHQKIRLISENGRGSEIKVGEFFGKSDILPYPYPEKTRVRSGENEDARK